MILHCYYCALGGDHATEASQVAIVDNLHKPLTADMFRPLRPEHDPSPPFQSDEWRYMLHRACGKYPWPYDVDPVSGPSRILTDKGMVEIPAETFKVPVEIIPDKSLSKVAQIKQILKAQTEGPVFTQLQIAQMVGTSTQYVSNVVSHMRTHKGGG